MHDDVVMLFDRHLRQLEAVRRTLCASRQVGWGERSDALAASVAASRQFATTAADLLAQIGDVTPQHPGELIQPGHVRMGTAGRQVGVGPVDVGQERIMSAD